MAATADTDAMISAQNSSSATSPGPDSAAPGLAYLKQLNIQGLTDMADLDDYAAAWAAAREQGNKWGGRGRGGRGLYNINKGTGKAVNLFNVTIAYHGNELLQVDKSSKAERKKCCAPLLVLCQKGAESRLCVLHSLFFSLPPLLA